MINVLYLGHSKKWRGGENQVRLLIQGMKKTHTDVSIHIAYPIKAMMIDRIGDEVDGIIELPSKKPFDLRSIFILVRYCNLHSICILHAHSGNTHSLALYVKWFLPKIIIIVHRHVDFKIKNHLFTRKKYLSKKINQYVTISSAIESRLVEYGIPINKIVVIKSSIDTTSYQNLDKLNSKRKICARYALGNHLPLIGFAGTLDENKDPITFVRSISKLRSDGIKVNAIMAGAGKLLSEIEQEIYHLKLSKNIKLIGFIDNMPEIFTALDIFVLPSTEEGLGTVLLEAVHANTNIIATNVGGIREIIIDGETGLLSKVADVNGFADAIKLLIVNPSEAYRLRHNALDHVNQEFCLKNMIKRNYQNYCRVIEQAD